MFGVHIGAFHGGVMRIENTEITRSGQALIWNAYTAWWKFGSKDQLNFGTVNQSIKE